MKLKRDSVVVVTGASSGLGREIALQCAERGCMVVLAARGREGLEATARLCRDRGGRPLVLETDVTHEGDVARLVKAVLERAGRIDVWVNNAGVTLFAPLTAGGLEEHRRVMEVNVFGAILCARAVVPVFRLQHEGVLINVGSVLSKIGQPFVGSYTVSKFALRGVSEALRAELADELDIHVCSIFPYAIDTPHFQMGASVLRREAQALPPLQSPEKVARAVLKLAEYPRRERHVPRIAALGLGLHWLMPRLTERLLLNTLRKWHFAERDVPSTAGNLHEPARGGGAVHGQRTPQVRLPMFAAWVMAELVRLEAESAERMVRRLRTRVQRPSIVQARSAGPAVA